ncbi:MAG TPA: carbohydrate ABC transporter substrate-binding protein [Xanthobacteraceae bacterium]|jgi:multiple sugar transport system substrate-binding protein|nr:carbohydrate ABC transporter substrate-binding protein [Xanthobacteraceae bacterium]
MLKVRALKSSRRDVIRLAAATAAVGPFFAFPDRTLASQPTLKIAKWAHFLPEYDAWFAGVLAAEWGRQHDTKVVVDHIPVESIHAAAAAEIAAGSGHDVFMFPWPPAEFQKHVIDHAEIYQTVAFKFGNLDRFAHSSTFNPTAKKYFAFADSWMPAPLHYFEDHWREVGMPLGPVHYGSLRSGGQRIREALGVPCGLALAPSLESNITLHTLLYAFRSHVIDAAGNVTIGKTALTVEALKYVKALYEDAGTPDQLAWDPSGNVRAMLARKTSCTINAINLLRTAEKEEPEVASKIRLSPPLLGHAGVLAFPHVTNCSVVWNFAQNQNGAKQFLADLIDNSKTAYEKSAGCNFPIYQKTVPNLIVRLEDDPRADPPYKYKELKDALHWTRNLGFPGYANPVGMEVFNSFVIPRMFISVVTGQSSPEDAAQAAQAEVTQIAERWKQV